MEELTGKAALPSCFDPKKAALGIHDAWSVLHNAAHDVSAIRLHAKQSDGRMPKSGQLEVSAAWLCPERLGPQSRDQP